MYGLSLRTERCPDGVELRDYGGKITETSRSRGKWFLYRTERRELLQLEIQNLESPVVVQFVNARDDVSLVKFFSKYGLLLEPDLRGGEDRGHYLTFTGCRDELRKVLAEVGGPNHVDALNAINEEIEFQGNIELNPMFDLAGENGRPRMLLRAHTLHVFMFMEAAMVAMNGARVFTCEYCGDIFLIGPLTGRRSHSRFCSDRCRVAAMRARNAKRAKSGKGRK
jgi:hypothetical protein